MIYYVQSLHGTNNIQRTRNLRLVRHSNDMINIWNVQYTVCGKKKNNRIDKFLSPHDLIVMIKRDIEEDK